jgi:hypothetical protein
MVKAMKKASVPNPAPKRAATTMSRTSPAMRLSPVATPMTPVAMDICFLSDMESFRSAFEEPDMLQPRKKGLFFINPNVCLLNSLMMQ